MTNSVLAPASETTASKIKVKLEAFMTKLDLAFQENFKLKREIA
jgi:BMFP domain-containing protein YqiC